MSQATDLDVTFEELCVSELFVWKRNHERGWTARATFTDRTRQITADGDSFSGALAALVAKLQEKST